MKGLLPFMLTGLLVGLIALVVSSARFSDHEDVLGVSASKSEISSGVTTQKTLKKTITGLAIWDNSLSSEIKVMTDKFTLGEPVNITTNGVEISAVINKITTSLTESTVLVVNKEFFIQLGGNPETESSIEVQVEN